MRYSLPLMALALALVVSGCSKDPNKRLQGKWLGDSVSNLSPEQSAEVSGWVKGVAFEFADSKMTVTVPAEQPRTGKFEVQDVKGDKVTVRVARDTGESDTVQLVFAEDDKLKWNVGEGRDVVLTRLR